MASQGHEHCVRDGVVSCNYVFLAMQLICIFEIEKKAES